jgi:hypothetical protein
VVLQPLLHLPEVPRQHEALLHGPNIAAAGPGVGTGVGAPVAAPSRAYGLYSIIVHSGEGDGWWRGCCLGGGGGKGEWRAWLRCVRCGIWACHTPPPPPTRGCLEQRVFVPHHPNVSRFVGAPGLTANSGHYFAYCRSSSAEGLHLADAPSCPWLKYNDTRVSVVTWSELTSELYDSLSDTCYLLLYRCVVTRCHRCPFPDGAALPFEERG